MEIKMVIADPKTGKCAQKTISDEDSKSLYNLKLGDNFKGELVGLNGYEFVLTGGSDYCGFPMHRSIKGVNRFKLLTSKGIGFRAKKKFKKKGLLKRKTVAGNTVFERTTQINVKIAKQGSEDLFNPQPKEGEQEQ